MPVRLFRYFRRFVKSFSKGVDYSKFPLVKEEDVQEQFIRGWGPGGQSVNRSENAVRLKHLPTGAVVKVNDHRSREQNLKAALERLRHAVDERLNGEDAVRRQEERLRTAEKAQREAVASERAEVKRRLKAELTERFPLWTKKELKEALKEALERHERDRR